MDQWLVDNWLAHPPEQRETDNVLTFQRALASESEWFSGHRNVAGTSGTLTAYALFLDTVWWDSTHINTNSVTRPEGERPGTFGESARDVRAFLLLFAWPDAVFNGDLPPGYTHDQFRDAVKACGFSDADLRDRVNDAE